MTKSEYLTWLNGRSYTKEIGSPVENSVESSAAISWTVYDIDLIELDGSGNGALVKHQFAVYDEGGGSEEVLNEYVPHYKENLSGYSALIAKIESITDLKSYWIRTISIEQQIAVVRSLIYGGGTIDIVWHLIYADSGLQVAVINNPEDF